MIQLLLLPLLLGQMCAALTTVDQPVTVCPPSVGSKYGRLPVKEFESDPDSDDPSWTRNY